MSTPAIMRKGCVTTNRPGRASIDAEASKRSPATVFAPLGASLCHLAVPTHAIAWCHSLGAVTAGPIPTAGTVIQVVLSSVANGDELHDIAWALEPLIPARNIFPAEVLLDLAADAIEESGATRVTPIDSEQIRQRLLPEGTAHTRAQHYKADFAIGAAAMIRAGIDPALLDHAARWSQDDLWYWSLEALIIYIRAAAQHADTTPADICGRIADRHGITLTVANP